MSGHINFVKYFKMSNEKGRFERTYCMPSELRKIISSTAYGIAFICFVYSCASSIILINGNSLQYEHPHGTAISAKVTHLTSSWS